MRKTANGKIVRFIALLWIESRYEVEAMIFLRCDDSFECGSIGGSVGWTELRQFGTLDDGLQSTTPAL